MFFHNSRIFHTLGATSMVNYGLKKVLGGGNQVINDMSGLGEMDDDEIQDIDEIRENMVLENYNPNLPDLAIDGIRKTDKMEILEPMGTVLKDENFEDEEEFDEAEIM